MPRAPKLCSACQLASVPAGVSQCDECTAKAATRGTAHQRGYGVRHRKGFRRGVLRHDPFCVCVDLAHGHGPRCLLPSTRADHYPRDRRELVRLGLSPNNPAYGRGLCASCDSKNTAARQPGGWHAR